MIGWYYIGCVSAPGTETPLSYLLSGVLLLKDSFDRFGGDSADDGVGRNVLRDNRPCRDDGVVADGHALQDRGVRTDPDVPSERDRRRVGRLAIVGRETVVECGEDDVMPNLAVVADGYAAVILKVAAGIDEYPAADMDVLAEIGVERREDAQRGIDLPPEQPREQGPHFVGRVVSVVQLEGDTSGLVAHFVHETVYVGRVERAARLHVFQKIGESHSVAYFRYSRKKPSILSNGITARLSYRSTWLAPGIISSSLLSPFSFLKASSLK